MNETTAKTRRYDRREFCKTAGLGLGAVLLTSPGVFGAEAQEASAHLGQWLAAGIEDYRLEFVHESADQVREIANAFAEAIAGRTTGEQLHRRLKTLLRGRVTEGSLFIPKGASALLPILQ